MTIGDDVEIGANSTIDRGAIGDTVIADGVKIDNLVQIGHNVRVGAHTVIAGCVGISGSATIGERCMIGGMVGIAGHLQICDDVVLTGRTMVLDSITSRACTRGALHEQPFGPFAAVPRASGISTSWRGGCGALERQVGLDRQAGWRWDDLLRTVDSASTR